MPFLPLTDERLRVAGADYTGRRALFPASRLKQGVSQSGFSWSGNSSQRVLLTWKLSLDYASSSVHDMRPRENRNLLDAKSWDRRWGGLRRGPRPLRAWRSYQDWLYTKLFRKFVEPGARILEIGCGGSRWLPFFARRFNAEVWGVDFSPNGVETARDALRRVGCAGNIVLGDLFTDTEVPQDYFDVVWSAGFIEHFTDTPATLRRISSYARSGGGLVITSVPNAYGVIGKLRQLGDPSTRESHIALSPSQLDASHRAAGLEVLQPARWFGMFSLTMVDSSRLRERLPKPLYVFLWRGVEVAQILVTIPFWISHLRAETKMFSPYVVGVYRRV